MHSDVFRLRWIFIAIILFMALTSIVSMVTLGCKRGIDFSGGMMIEFKILNKDASELDLTTVRKSLSVTISDISFLLQDLSFGKFAMRIGNAISAPNGSVKQIDDSLTEKVKHGIISAFGDVSFEQIESIGPHVSSDLVKQAWLGLLFACFSILLYMALRFHWKFSIAGVIVLFLDVIIACGFISITRFELNLTLVAALLTIIGYCVNDTVVIYDRIRANFNRYNNYTSAKIISLSVSETLRRSIITSLVTLLSLVGIMFFADTSIRNFAFVVSFGIVIGTCGSIFIAPSLLLLMRVTKFKKGNEFVDPMFYAS